MPHTLPVYDTGPYFEIDPLTRMLKNKKNLKITVIQNDHLSERIGFRLPRYIDGYDLLECNRIEVHYLNTENGTKMTSEGCYLIEDAHADPNDGEMLLCSWLISINATRYVGALYFLLRFVCIEENETVYARSTAICKEISVAPAIYCADTAIDAYPDVLAQWEARVNALSLAVADYQKAIPSIDSSLSVSGAAADAAAVGERFSALGKQIEDILYQPMEILRLTNNVNTAEIGSVVRSITLDWETNKTPASLTLDGASLNPEFIGYAMTEQNVTKNKTFTLKAVDERGAEAVKTTSIAFVNGVYYGIAAANEAPDSAFVHTFTKTLRSSKLTQFTVNAGERQYIYYCVPSRFGACTLSVNGFSGGFPLIATIAFTNASGYTENYDIYRSDYANLGNTTVTVR